MSSNADERLPAEPNSCRNYGENHPQPQLSGHSQNIQPNSDVERQTKQRGRVRKPPNHSQHSPDADRVSGGSKNGPEDSPRWFRGMLKGHTPNNRPRDDRSDDKDERNRQNQHGYHAGTGPVPQPHSAASYQENLFNMIQMKQNEILDLQKHVTYLENLCNQQQRRINAMQNARDAQDDILGFQEQDMNIFQQFKNVYASIKTWSNKFPQDASRPMDTSGIPTYYTEIMQNVIPEMTSMEDLPRYLPPNDTKRRRKFIRGWIACNVFQTMAKRAHGQGPLADVWIPKDLRDLAMDFERDFSPGKEVSQAGYHERRALTFSLLSKAFPLQKWTRYASEDMNHVLGAVLLALKPLAAEDADHDLLVNRLRENVLIPAIELSQIMRLQRAYWYVGSPLKTQGMDTQLFFRPDEMCDEEGNDDERPNDKGGHRWKPVDMVTLPALYKSGNHDGEHYDSEFVVVKAHVYCKRSSGPGPSHEKQPLDI